MPFFKRTDNTKLNEIIFQCNCHSDNHKLTFHWDDNEKDPELTINVVLTKYNFIKRLRAAFLYIIGRSSKYDFFEESVFFHEEVKELYNYLGDYLKRTKV